MTTDSKQKTLPPGKLPGDMLDHLISAYRTPADESVIVGASYGFDAAALSVGGETLVIKSDPITFATESAAHYLVAVNANDIACMGAIPRWMTVVALLPEDATSEHLLEGLFADLQQACIAANVSLVGGHTEITLGLDRPLLIGTMLGLAGDHGLLEPGRANAGDDLYLTKWAGLEGTAILANEKRDELSGILSAPSLADAANLIHAPGISVIQDARLALSTGTVTALHDPTEGGVATAVHEIAEASSLGALIDHDAIPIRDDTRTICNHFGITPLGLISSGALLVASSPGSANSLVRAFEASGIDISRIGTLTAPEEGIHIQHAGDTYPLPRYDSDEVTRVL